MNEINHRDLAKRLVLRAIQNYKQKFMLEEDLLCGEDRRRIVEEMDNISQEVKADNRQELLAQIEMYKKMTQDLEQRLNQACNLDCNEEFEL